MFFFYLFKELLTFLMCIFGLPYQYSFLIFHIILAFSFYSYFFIFLNERQKQRKKKKSKLHYELSFLYVNPFCPINFSPY